MNPKGFAASAPGRVVRASGGYWAFVPNPLPPPLPWSGGLVTALSRADRAIGELAGLGRYLPNPQLLIQPFMRREAVFSSRIEGTRASLSDLYVYEAGQRTLFDLPDDVREVHNYARALEYGMKRLERLPVSLRLMREMHAVLMDGVRGQEKTPGEFRRSQNWIGPPGVSLNQATFVPPPVEAMTQALHQLEEFLHAPSDLPPLLRLGLIHYQFEAIHPFLDGNGRLGRLLLILLLYDWQVLPAPLLYLSPYLEARRGRYYELLLRVSQRGDWEAWLVFFLQAVAAQANDAVQRIRRLGDLRDRYRHMLGVSRATARLLQAVDLFFARPVLSTRQLAEAIEVNFSTAQRYIDRLTAAGILREATGRARNRLYRAEAVLQALEAPPEEYS